MNVKAKLDHFVGHILSKAELEILKIFGKFLTTFHDQQLSFKLSKPIDCELIKCFY